MPERRPPGPRSVFTDGACSGNPGPGGWAWALDSQNFASGFAAHTTNQRMEIQAAFEAVKALEGPLEIVSDSTYVVNCFRQSWWRGWLARGWINSQRKPVANRDLWEPFVELVRTRGDVSFRWIKGHGGDVMNDFVDQLAVEAARNRRGRAAGSGQSEASGKVPARQPIAALESAEVPKADVSMPERPPPQAAVHMVCGATDAGKTDYAIQLAAEKRALRFSIDEWMEELFAADAPELAHPWRAQRIGRCERRIWAVCRAALGLGTDVVLDLGFTTRDQRDRFRTLAAGAGARVSLHYLELPARTRRPRGRAGHEGQAPSGLALESAEPMLGFMEPAFEAPGSDELQGGVHVKPRRVRRP